MPTQPPNTLSATAMTTLDQVKLYLAKDDLDPTSDDRISWLINVASAAVSSYAQREFVSTLGTASVARNFDVNDTGTFVSLAPYDAQSISSVALQNSAGTTTTVQAAYWTPGATHKPNGVYGYLKFSPYVTLSPGDYTGLGYTAIVTGVWGFPSVPPDVENAVVGTVCQWYKRDQSTPSPEFDLNPSFQESATGMNLPYEARVLLQAYKRPVGL